MSNIPSIIKEAELSLEKLDGMIDAEDYSKLKEAVDELGASFRKRAYGYTLNELYTVATLLKSKKINVDDLNKALKMFDNVDDTAPIATYQHLLDLVMTVRSPEEYNKLREELRAWIIDSGELIGKFKNLLSTQIFIQFGRQNGKTSAMKEYIDLVNELRVRLGLSEEPKKD